jgi:hypothetical protein
MSPTDAPARASGPLSVPVQHARSVGWRSSGAAGQLPKAPPLQLCSRCAPRRRGRRGEWQLAAAAAVEQVEEGLRGRPCACCRPPAGWSGPERAHAAGAGPGGSRMPGRANKPPTDAAARAPAGRSVCQHSMRAQWAGAAVGQQVSFRRPLQMRPRARQRAAQCAGAACALSGPVQPWGSRLNRVLFNVPARDSVVIQDKILAARPEQIVSGVDLVIFVSYLQYGHGLR